MSWEGSFNSRDALGDLKVNPWIISLRNVQIITKETISPLTNQLSEEDLLSLGTFQEFHQILSLCVVANTGHTLAHNPILISMNIILVWVEIWFLR